MFECKKILVPQLITSTALSFHSLAPKYETVLRPTVVVFLRGCTNLTAWRMEYLFCLTENIRYIKLILSRYTIYLLIRTSYIAILCGETPIPPLSKNQSFAEFFFTSSPYRAHTAPLLLADRLLSVSEINSYIVGIFMYNCINGILPSTFSDYV